MEIILFPLIIVAAVYFLAQVIPLLPEMLKYTVGLPFTLLYKAYTLRHSDPFRALTMLFFLVVAMAVLVTFFLAT